jgi:protein TonB
VPSFSQETVVVRPEDRLFALADPFWRRARRRFPQLLFAVLLLHLTVLLFLFLNDQPDKDIAQPEKEIPVQIIVQPPPPPPPPPPKPEQKKPEPPKPKPPQYEREEKPAFDAPRAPNQETIKREAPDDQTRAPVMAKPAPANDTKPTPEVPKPAQNAAPEAAQQTTSPEEQKDDKDAEALSKAAPIKDKKTAVRMRQTKRRAPLPDNEAGAVARELASLMPSPNYTFAAKTEVSPVSGGTEDMRYLSVLFGLIMRQRHFPTQVVHDDVQVVVAFWIDDTGRLVQTELYRTSGYPEFDREAVAAVRRAAPFPQPPYGEPHGFIAKMEFPAR